MLRQTATNLPLPRPIILAFTSPRRPFHITPPARRPSAPTPERSLSPAPAMEPPPLDDKHRCNSILIPAHLYPYVFSRPLANAWEINPKVAADSEHSFTLDKTITKERYPLSRDQCDALLTRWKEISALHKHHTDSPLPETLSLPFVVSITTHRTRYPPTPLPGFIAEPNRPTRPPQGLTLRDLHLANAYETALDQLMG